MSPVFTVGLALAALLIFFTLTRREERVDSDRADKTFDDFLAESDPRIANVAKVALPALRSTTVSKMAGASVTRSLRDKVSTSGLFGGNVEVFLAFQVTLLAVGIALEALALTASFTGMQRITLALFGVAAAFGPYAKVSEKAKKVAAETEAALPYFAEIMQVALASAMSVQQALAFTVRQAEDTPVSRQAAWLVSTLEAGGMPEREAYDEAGRRLGSPEALAFFSALGQASSEGTKVMEILDRQSRNLRAQSHQRRRQEIKKIPVALVVKFAVHFLPLLFVITMFPLISAFGSI